MVTEQTKPVWGVWEASSKLIWSSSIPHSDRESIEFEIWSGGDVCLPVTMIVSQPLSRKNKQVFS